MAKKFQLQIPKPCHKDWDQMKPADRGRYCDSCQKQVIDFSGMNDEQIIAFFKRPSTASVCGRFSGAQLERDFLVTKKRIPWMKYFFQFSIPVFLASLKSNAQTGKVALKTETVCNRENQQMVTRPAYSVLGDTVISSVPPHMTALVSGRVTDPDGSPMPGAIIQVKGTLMATVSDAQGRFILELESSKPLVLVASMVGFETIEQPVQAPDRAVEILFTKEDEDILGDVVIVGLIRRKPEKPVPVIEKRMMDPEQVDFRLYPNPVRAGSEINIDWKELPEDDMQAVLYSLAGQQLFSQQLASGGGIRQMRLHIPILPAGTYVLQLSRDGEKTLLTSTRIVIH